MATIWSQSNLSVVNVEGDVVGTASAVGNAVQVFSMTNSVIENNQVNTGNIGAELNADVAAVTGSVGLTAAAICNTADLSSDPEWTAMSSNQECRAKDPSATINASISGVGGDAVLQAAAIGNNMTFDTNATELVATNSQLNRSATYATINADISDVAGSVGATAQAVGNSASIIRY